MKEINGDTQMRDVWTLPAFALSLAGLERISGINQRQLSHYINGSSKTRKSTVKRFQKRLEAFAKDLLSASILM